MKILLVSANTHEEPFPVYPLGLDYVAGSIAAAHTVWIADLNAFQGIDEFTEDLRAKSPDVVGVSLRNVDTTDITDARGFAGLYKKVIDAVRSVCGAVIVLGGSAFTLFPAEFMTVLDADYGIVGEGERLRLFLSALESGRNPETVPGVVVRGSSVCPPPPWQETVTRYFNKDFSHPRYYLSRGGMLNLQTKRGCPFKCIYCTYPQIEGRRLRYESPAQVAEMAQTLASAGAKYFFVADASYNSDISHSLAVADAIRDKKVRIPWGAFFSPVSLPDGYFERMADAGLTHVEFGTESLSDPVLSALGKPFRVPDILKAHRSAVNAGLHVAHYFLFGGPGETPQTVSETLAHADRLSSCVFFFFCGIRIYPGTPLHRIALAEGRISRDASLLAPVFYKSPFIDEQEIRDRVNKTAAGRINWVVGSGGGGMVRIVRRLHRRGHAGPLWENLNG